MGDDRVFVLSFFCHRHSPRRYFKTKISLCHKSAKGWCGGDQRPAVGLGHLLGQAFTGGELLLLGTARDVRWALQRIQAAVPRNSH